MIIVREARPDGRCIIKSCLKLETKRGDGLLSRSTDDNSTRSSDGVFFRNASSAQTNRKTQMLVVSPVDVRGSGSCSGECDVMIQDA